MTKMTMKNPKSFTQQAADKVSMAKQQNVEGASAKKYDEELDKIPHYMRERVAYLIDQKVEKRVREFMEDFRKEIYQELSDQRKQNEEHIQYYAS